MVNITTEAMLDLKQAAIRCGVSVKTIRNWAARVSGPRLETAKLGGKVVTTLEALQRFTVQRDSVIDRHRQPEPSRRIDQAAHEEAMRQLRNRHGVTV